MIGMRTLKTALAASLCMLIYQVLFKNLQNLGPFYAAIAAVISMQPTTNRTKKIAINRIIGTIIGGMYSTFLFSIYLLLNIATINFLFIFVGTLLIIITCNKLGFSSGISTGCIVLIGAFTLDYPSSPFFHAFFRTIDTTIGVIIAYYVNYLLPGGEIKN